MSLVPTQKYRIALAILVLATGAGAAAAAFSRRVEASAPATETVAGLYATEAEGFRYEYHAPTGTEGLYELRTLREPPVDVLAAHPEIAARCRTSLQKKLGVANLDELRAAHADTIRRLKALGYL
jgi:hypothetical protein